MTDANVDTATGRVKEAAGALTGNEELKREGQVAQAKGSAKKFIDRFVDAITNRKAK